MLIQITSDLHLNFYNSFDSLLGGLYNHETVAKKPEVLVIAGDLTPAMDLEKGKPFIKTLCELYPHIVYVFGNHDFYHTSIGEGKKEYKEFFSDYSNFHILDREIFDLEGVTFAGATLWFPDVKEAKPYKSQLNDFACIASSEQIYEEEKLDREFLLDVSAKVVVTHHMPSEASTSEMFRGSPTNAFFINPILDRTDLNWNAKLYHWVHGHTHTACKYMHNRCSVLCNPVGYPSENPNWENLYLDL